jgi:hypothetical protein
MKTNTASHLSDVELVAEVKRLAGREREATVQLVAHLAEMDARRLYLGAGFSSLFTYCTQVLRLSEHEAYNRIEAARAARRFPVILDMLAEGSLNLTTVRLLAPHLTSDNHEGLLAAASGGSKRAVEELLVQHFPLPPVGSSVRKLPTPKAPDPVAPVPGGSAENAVSRGAMENLAALPVLPPQPPGRTVAPLSPDRYAVRFTVSAKTCEKLRLAQDLLRHAVPSGDTAEIFDRALTALLEDLARKKLAAAKRPRPSRGATAGSRHIPAEVKRTVWLRDGGRCAFMAQGGRRCRERAFVEFHHVTPHGVGGEPTVDNIALRCRAHNAYEADLYYGPRHPGGGGGRTTRSGTSSRAQP